MGMEMSTIADFVEKLEPTKKCQFIDTFFRIWSINGFGTMTKKDTELLLFRCLSDLLDNNSALGTNYQWAHLLRVTPQKIKPFNWNLTFASGISLLYPRKLAL